MARIRYTTDDIGTGKGCPDCGDDESLQPTAREAGFRCPGCTTVWRSY